jgi:hypothetical protein
MEIKQWKTNVVEITSTTRVLREDVLSFVSAAGYALDPSVEMGIGVMGDGDSYSWFVPVL